MLTSKQLFNVGDVGDVGDVDNTCKQLTTDGGVVMHVINVTGVVSVKGGTPPYKRVGVLQPAKFANCSKTFSC